MTERGRSGQTGLNRFDEHGGVGGRAGLPVMDPIGQQPSAVRLDSPHSTTCALGNPSTRSSIGSANAVTRSLDSNVRGMAMMLKRRAIPMTAPCDRVLCIRSIGGLGSV